MTITATISEKSERAAQWRQVFGADTIPLQGVMPQWATLPGFETDQLVYMVAIEQLTPAQRAAVVAHIAERFDLAADLVDAELETYGLPVLADEVTVTTTWHPLVFLDDFDDEGFEDEGVWDDDWENLDYLMDDAWDDDDWIVIDESMGDEGEARL